MPAKIFISQALIDSWVSQEVVDLSGNLLTLRSGAGALRLEPASHFRKVSGGSDTNGLQGKVKTAAAIQAMGGEAYMDSVIVGENAYDVDPGFVAEPVPPSAAAVLVRALRMQSTIGD